MKKNEHIQQTMVVRWFRLQYPLYQKCLFAIPNGGKRNIITAIKLKEEGVLAGVSDLFLMISRHGKHGMFIEMKDKGGRITIEQKNFIELANLMGYQTALCFGFDEAKSAIQAYLQE